MSPRRRWMIVSGLALLLILAPFFLFEEAMTRWAARLLAPGRHPTEVSIAVVVLLAADVVLPVPSSMVSTAAGVQLGFLPAFFASTAGMTLGSLIGYALGRVFGEPLVRAIVHERELEEVSARFRRRGAWALALLRPVPVLAEASTMFAGLSRFPLGAYVAVTTLANAGISLVYSAAGATARRTSWLLALAAAAGLPGLAMLLRYFGKRRERPGS